MTIDGLIVDWALYGEHIPLRCKNHPDKRWSTKNIGGIGARSLFYNLMMKPGMGSECPCSISLLEPLSLEEAQAECYPDASYAPGGPKSPTKEEATALIENITKQILEASR
jgi:hypothetical protein